MELDDPQLTALKSAARAAIVMPAVFLFADKVIQDPQTELFAAFGSIAMLVFADFTGPLRSRFLAYVALGFAGAVNVVIGTLCSRSAWVAAIAMAVVGFVILFSGDQRVLRRRRDAGDTRVRSAGDARGAELGHSCAPGGMGAGCRRRNAGSHGALARAAAHRAPW